MSTGRARQAAERFIRARGAVPTFKGYRGFPASICASPNSMVVHGIPGPERLKSADIISIDVGVTLDGWVADAARTFPVEQISPEAQNLLAATEASLLAGVSSVRRRATAWGTSRAPSSASPRRLGCPSSGRWSDTASDAACTRIHRCPTTASPARGLVLEEGMVLAIEPMMTAGRPAVRVGGDGWAISSDGRLAGRAFRVHRRDHRRGSAHPDAVAHPRGRPGATDVQRGRVDGRRGSGARAGRLSVAGRPDDELATIRSPARMRGRLPLHESISTTW